LKYRTTLVERANTSVSSFTLKKPVALKRNKKRMFLAGPMREIPNGQDGLTLPALVANQNRQDSLLLALRGSATNNPSLETV